jgi:hypothetical protein
VQASPPVREERFVILARRICWGLWISALKERARGRRSRGAEYLKPCSPDIGSGERVSEYKEENDWPR